MADRLTKINVKALSGATSIDTLES